MKQDCPVDADSPHLLTIDALSWPLYSHMRLFFPALLLYALSPLALAQVHLHDTTIVIKAIEGLQFSEKRIVLRPQTRLTLVVQNHDDMAHNLVVTRPNSRARVVEFALAMGESGAARNYVPTLPDVLANTHLLKPDDHDTLRIELTEEGDFPYVCTYPGHGSLMYGMLYVTTNLRRLPPPDRDPNLPNVPTDAHQHHAASANHPYPLRLPAIYRTFMPDASPAAIAVGLPGTPQQAYCWDATTCQLRYAWEGGFVDNAEHWEGKGQRLTKVIGDIFFRDSTFQTPWQVGAKPAQVRFRGYTLVSRFPEFTYTADGILIRELTKAQPKRRGLVRQFTIAPRRYVLRFRLGDATLRYRASAGRIEGGYLIVPPAIKSVTLSSF
jgi:azurin